MLLYRYLLILAMIVLFYNVPIGDGGATEIGDLHSKSLISLMVGVSVLIISNSWYSISIAFVELIFLFINFYIPLGLKAGFDVSFLCVNYGHISLTGFVIELLLAFMGVLMIGADNRHSDIGDVFRGFIDRYRLRHS